MKLVPMRVSVDVLLEYADLTSPGEALALCRASKLHLPEQIHEAIGGYDEQFIEVELLPEGSRGIELWSVPQSLF